MVGSSVIAGESAVHKHAPARGAANLDDGQHLMHAGSEIDAPDALACAKRGKCGGQSASASGGQLAAQTRANEAGSAAR